MSQHPLFLGTRKVGKVVQYVRFVSRILVMRHFRRRPDSPDRVLLRFTCAFAGMPSLFECIDLRKQMDQNADIVEKLSRQVTLHRLRRRINSKPRAHYILHASRASYCWYRHLALSPALLPIASFGRLRVSAVREANGARMAVCCLQDVPCRWRREVCASCKTAQPLVLLRPEVAFHCRHVSDHFAFQHSGDMERIFKGQQ